VLGFLARRTAWTAAMMLAVCLFTFVVFFVVPRHTSGFVYRTEQSADDMPRATGLSGPVSTQFAQFVEKVFVEGDLGRSFANRRDVTAILADAVPVTVSIVLGGAVLWLLIAIPLGFLSALRPGSLIDRAGTIFVLVGLSVHPVAIGVLLSWLLGLHWHLFPFVGYCDLVGPSTSCGGPTQWAYHLVLPWLTYALLFAAVYVRMIRATLREQLQADYVVTARAKGASEWRILTRHVMRNALMPLTAMVSMDLVPRMLLSIVFVERVFDLPGLGRAVWQSIDRNDLPVTMGVTLFFALATCVLNLAADVAAAALDPRTKRPWRLRRADGAQQERAAAPVPAALPQRAS
jgi:peptide/nickel transport system permease protein